MSLIAIIFGSALFTLLFRRAFHWVVVVYLGLWIYVPFSFVAIEFGSRSLLGLHPGSIFILTAFGFLLLYRPKSLGQALKGRASVFFLAVLFFLYLGITSTGGGQPQTVINQLLAPLCGLILVLFVRFEGKVKADRIVGGLLFLLLVEAGLGLAEATVRENLFYLAQNKAYYPTFSSHYLRPMGTTSHPLVFGTLMAAGLPLLASVKRVLPQIFMLLVLGSAVLMSESRGPLIVAVVAVVYLIFRARLSLLGRIVFSAGVITAAVFVLGNTGSFGIFRRIENDQYSAATRETAYQWFFDSFWNLAPVGRGMATSFAVASDAGLSSSFESSIIQFIIDFGLIPGLLFFVGLLVMLTLPPGAKRRVGAAPATAALVGCTVTFSSLSVNTALGPVLMVLLGLSLPLLARERVDGASQILENSSPKEPSRI